jgi:hypothetical protein
VKRHSQNKFLRGFLRTIDVLMAIRFGRSVRWDKEPFQKATKAQSLYGGLFMAVLPIFFLIFMGNYKSFDAALNSMIAGRHSIIWLYVGTFVLVGGIGGLLFVIAPKTPLFVSVPIAIVMWPILGWFIWNT